MSAVLSSALAFLSVEQSDVTKLVSPSHDTKGIELTPILGSSRQRSRTVSFRSHGSTRRRSNSGQRAHGLRRNTHGFCRRAASKQMQGGETDHRWVWLAWLDVTRRSLSHAYRNSVQYGEGRDREVRIIYCYRWACTNDVNSRVPVLHEVRDITLARNDQVALVSYENKVRSCSKAA